LEKHADSRGFFARTYCEREFDAQNLNFRFVQSSISFNKLKGTLRGMHYQAPPHEEIKLIRCSRGAIFDVIIDLRSESPTFKQHCSATLTEENGKMLYVPGGFAHGFQTLEDNTEVFYQMNEFYAPAYARGVRWNDPAFGIKWPADERIIIDRDRSYSDFVD
jgi:dTDP-4-dehydrorhamnose 3,5-epimerase